MFSRSSVGEIGVNIREDTETSILIKRTFSFLYYCFNISKVTCAAKPLIHTSSPLAFRLIAYGFYVVASLEVQCDILTIKQEQLALCKLLLF